MKTNHDAEHYVLQQLDAENPDTLESFADFAAGEIDDKHIAGLLLAILQTDSSRWAFMLAGIRQHSPDLAEAIDKVENELERQRAKFIESHAADLVRQGGLHNQTAAEAARIEQ